MSQLSLPSLSLLPTDDELRRGAAPGGGAPFAADRGTPRSGDWPAERSSERPVERSGERSGERSNERPPARPLGFAWPTPPLAAYPLPVPALEPEPCEVEGRGGKRVAGLLVGFDPDEGVARVQVPPERIPVSLRFNQIRRITLKRSLAPLSAAMVADAQGPAPERVLAHHPSQPYAFTLTGGERLVGRTVGHVEHPAGVFLFAPLDALGSVQRLFVPRASIEQQQLGEPVGQLLVAQQAATPAQLEQALLQQQALRERKLGEQLIEREVVSPEQLLAALDKQARMPAARLGDALIALGYLSDQQLQDALHQQRRDREQPLGQVLREQGVVDATQLRVALAGKLGYPVVDVAHFPVDRALLAQLPLTAARRLQVLPLMRRGGRLVVAMHDASRQDVIDELQRLIQGPVAPTLSGDENLAEAIERAYGGGASIAYKPDTDWTGGRAADRAEVRVDSRSDGRMDNRNDSRAATRRAGAATSVPASAALSEALAAPMFVAVPTLAARAEPPDIELPADAEPGVLAMPALPATAASFAGSAGSSESATSAGLRARFGTAPADPPPPSDFATISLDAGPTGPAEWTAHATSPAPIEPPPLAASASTSASAPWPVPTVASASLTWTLPPDLDAAAAAGDPPEALPTEAAALPVGEAAELRDTQVAALTGLGALVGNAAAAAEPRDPPDRREPRSRRERQHAEAADAAASARAAADRHESPLLQALSHLVLDALQRGATSVQIESHGLDDKLQVRLRRGGRLELHSELPASYRSPLFARIKALSDLDVAETRRPQEGRLAFGRLVPQHKLDLRVLTLPTHSGLEDIVLGLPTRLKPLALDAIGLGATELERLQGLLTRPSGLILCVGPARSGRTTSLHAMLGQLIQPERRIWTLEEPVALPQPGLRQMEIRPEEGQTFESGLRSVLATDADVLMVGQINDVGAARLAIDAALQGRLVLAGMTARNASDALMRLIDQGVTPWDLSDALLGVHSQRLLRRLCSTCRMSRSAKDTEVEEWIEGYFHGAVVADPQAEREALLRGWLERHGRDGRLRRYQSPGCDRCGHTGQRGRVAVHELLLVTRELRRLIRAGAPAWNLQRQAQKDGMHTLRQEAVEKMVAGQVSLDEVRTVIDL